MEIRTFGNGRFMVSFNGITYEGTNLRLGIQAVYEFARGGRK